MSPHTAQVPSQRLGEWSIRCYTVIFAWKSLIFRLATRQHQCNVECKLRGLVMICVDSLGTAQPSTANMQTRHRPTSLLIVTTDNWAQSRTFLRAPDCVGLEVSDGRSLSCCYRSKHLVAWQGRCYVLWRGIKMCPGRCLFKLLATLVARE